MPNAVVYLKIGARVHVSFDDMYEHQNEVRADLENVKNNSYKERIYDCDCGSKEATEKEISECIARERYTENQDDIDFSWYGCESNAPHLPFDASEE